MRVTATVPILPSVAVSEDFLRRANARSGAAAHEDRHDLAGEGCSVRWAAWPLVPGTGPEPASAVANPNPPAVTELPDSGDEIVAWKDGIREAA